MPPAKPPEGCEGVLLTPRTAAGRAGRPSRRRRSRGGQSGGEEQLQQRALVVHEAHVKDEPRSAPRQPIACANQKQTHADGLRERPMRATGTARPSDRYKGPPRRRSHLSSRRGTHLGSNGLAQSHSS